ncbi:hypothetical protein KP79_PYT16634 [Mizuhopecten yessoensis]|uniref:Uncharacterized protein n=1 Tax=Mizuhopecten yessoensis TaxID=6573 RepID=A0A210QQU0_MIZYE|nr:hypothetical protein KP79_PYT16634 [Mizuhopecten yessoensis]
MQEVHGMTTQALQLTIFVYHLIQNGYRRLLYRMLTQGGYMEQSTNLTPDIFYLGLNHEMKRFPVRSVDLRLLFPQ